jgi:ubiquinone/menaquinone biosynthesis C-methylase UbiE
MIMEQDLNSIENLYDKVAREYAERFFGEHEKKPKDQEILRRFAQEIGGRRPVWDFGCGPGQTTQYLTNLGIDISGLDLSERILERARMIHPEIHFRKGNILELEFENDSIAGAVAFYAIVHFSEEQVRRACHEVFRVLQPEWNIPSHIPHRREDNPCRRVSREENRYGFHVLHYRFHFSLSKKEWIQENRGNQERAISRS